MRRLAVVFRTSASSCGSLLGMLLKMFAIAAM
jgi:hypothetical protein